MLGSADVLSGHLGVREETAYAEAGPTLRLEQYCGSPLVCACWESFRGKHSCLLVDSEEGSPAVLCSPVTGREGGGDPREATHQGMLLGGSDISEDPVLYPGIVSSFGT